MLDPFKLMTRLFVAFFTIFGYLVAGFCESVWYLTHARPDRVGAAMGDTMRGIVNALAAILRE
jgi:hypothetical protein